MAQAPVYLKLEGVPVVTLYVGSERVVFYVHQNLLFDASTVFKAAFSSNFQEASERSMSLPDHDSGSVERMIQWLYTRKFKLTVPASPETSDECYMQLAKLNTLADKYDIYLLKNRIVDELFDLTKPPRNIRPPQIPVVEYVYNNTTEGSSFRKLIDAWFVYRIDFAWYDKDTTKDELAKTPPEFAIDLAMEFGARQKDTMRSSPFTLPSSAYHEKPSEKIDEDRA